MTRAAKAVKGGGRQIRALDERGRRRWPEKNHMGAAKERLAALAIEWDERGATPMLDTQMRIRRPNSKKAEAQSPGITWGWRQK